MTQREKDLNINLTPLVEDVFYIILAIEEKISGEQGMRTYNRIKGKYSEKEYKDAIVIAQQMLDNIQKYGVACAAWE